jgi:hypothetical protein
MGIIWDDIQLTEAELTEYNAKVARGLWVGDIWQDILGERYRVANPIIRVSDGEDRPDGSESKTDK